MDAGQQLPCLPAAIGQQLARKPAYSSDTQKFSARYDSDGQALGIVNNLEILLRRKSQANGESGKRINALCIACRFTR
jgi:hypothetical protein